MAKKQSNGRSAAPARAPRAAAATAMQTTGSLAYDGPEPGVLLGVDEDEQLAAEVGKSVVGFLKGLGAFFTTARALEQTALQLADTAKLLEIPGDQESDEELQKFIKRTSEHKRTVEAHWSITATVSKFHRRMTARRAKSTDACDQANARANQLHNAYVQEEQRRARAEQERIRREAEERERLEREAEMRKAEEEATARELAAPDLSAREQRFVELLMQGGDLTGQRAARAAGYKDPVAAAAKLLASAKITAAIKAKQEAEEIRRQAAAAAAMPRTTAPVETVAPRVTKVGTSRTYHSAELLDESALLEAILAQVAKHERGPIPLDLLRIDTSRLNDYARQLEAKINLWPGVRHKADTKLV